MENTYYLCPSHEPDPIRWNPYAPSQDQTVQEAYFGEVFRFMESYLQTSGFTFYLTWDVAELPSYGSDVIAVVMGDEWARFPLYASKIRATFKCYGIRLPVGWNPLHRPFSLNALTALKYLKVQANRLPYSTVSLYHQVRDLLSPSEHPSVFPIPLGYANQIDLPVKDITDRDYDFQFAGSVSHGQEQGLRRWLRTPKSISRTQMLEKLEAYQKKRPDLEPDIFLTSGFGPHAAIWGDDQFDTMRDAEEYSRALMNTKVCLVPRGSSLETFRYFEALRAGCIVVTEALPSRWFYDEAPIFQLDDWSELDTVLDLLLEDEGLLLTYHQASLEWWDEVCSEEAVGQYLARRIDSPEMSVSPEHLPTSEAPVVAA